MKTDKTLKYFKSVLNTIWKEAGIPKSLQTKTKSGTMSLKEKALISIWSEHCQIIDEIKQLNK